MSVITSVATGATILAADLNQYKNLLEGGGGVTETFVLTSTAGTNFIVKLGDAAGANKFAIQTSAGAEVWSVNSSGTITGGTLSPTALVLPNSATPSQTTEGSIAWDTDDDVITVGTGAATKRLGLTRGAGSLATANNEMVFDTTSKMFQVWNGSSNWFVGPIYKYKSATQVFSTTTTLADVTASSGTFSHAIGANEVWLDEFRIPIAQGGTGGAKFQISGPSAPADVNITGVMVTGSVSGSSTITLGLVVPFTPVTAFATDIASASGGSTAGSGTFYVNNALDCFIHIFARIINGANAGTITLQAAQNNSNSTTTLGLGSYMIARRLA